MASDYLLYMANSVSGPDRARSTKSCTVIGYPSGQNGAILPSRGYARCPARKIAGSSDFIVTRTITDRIGPLQDPVTWYKITHAGLSKQRQVQVDWYALHCFESSAVQLAPHASMSDFVQCDQIVQRAYWTPLSFF